VAAFPKNKILVGVFILSFVFSACRISPNLELTATELPPNSEMTELPSQTPEPTQTPFPTQIPQIETNCPPGGWSQFTEEDGLVDNWPRTLAVDDDGRVYVGYLIGNISFLQNGIWTTFPEKLGSPKYEVNVIIPLENGDLWVGTQGGYIAIYHGRVWKMFPSILVDGENTTVYDLETAPDGRVWAATWDGIFQLQGDDWQPLSKPVPDDSLFSGKSLYLDNEGGLWVGARRGLYYYKDGVWKPSVSVGTGHQNIENIEVDRSGNIWFGGMGSIFIFDGTTWTRVFPGEGISSNPGDSVSVSDLAVGPDGRVWTTYSGLAAVFENGAWLPVIPGVGSKDIKVYRVDLDPWGAAWFVSNEGILCYNP